MTAIVSAPARVSARPWRWVGPCVGCGVVAAALAGTWLASGPGGRSLGHLMGDNVLTNAVDGVELGGIAAILLLLRPANRVGWLLMYAGGVNALAILGEGWALASYHVDLPGRAVMAWLASWVWVTALILGATVLPAIYPTGRAVDRTRRWIVRIGWGCSLLVGACLALLDEAFRAAAPGQRIGPNPISGGRFQGPVTAVAIMAAACGVLLVIFSLAWTVRRLRRAASPEREQLAWLLLAVVPSVLVGLVAPPPVTFVVNLLTAVALLVGIVRHQLFDIKLVLRSGLVYGVLIAAAVAVYLGVVAAITVVTPPGTVPSLFAAAVVALLARPAYSWLAAAAGRLVYGDRADPVRALTRVGAAESTTDLDSMVRAVAASVRSPRVLVRGLGGELVAQTGAAVQNPTHEVALRHDGAGVGTLAVAWRTPADRLSPADLRLVDALAGPVAVAVRATQLTREVSESRARVVGMREAERRCLRHDLHDSLGPSLSGMALGLEAALRAGEAERVREILEVVHHEMNRLVAEVRNLIDDLGPAGLDPGGLVQALRAHAEAVSSLGDLRVRVVAGSLPELTPPVEVALYRIATEALTNVVHHARATCATLEVDGVGSSVRLTVVDDGCGTGSAAAGVGRSSMRERAGAVGGTLSVTDRPGGGTAVVALLPLQEVGRG